MPVQWHSPAGSAEMTNEEIECLILNLFAELSPEQRKQVLEALRPMLDDD